MRYATPAPTPPQPTTEGDEKFYAMDMATERSMLGSGFYPLAINYRCDDGHMKQRGGTIKPGFANILVLTAILGSGAYSNPNGDNCRLIADVDKVVMIRDRTYPSIVPIPAGVVLSGRVEFSQQFDKVLLHRGASAKALVWDGISSSGFIEVEKSDPLNTVTTVLPNVDWSINMDGRAVIPLARDTLAASDQADYTSFDLGLDGPVFRINSGTADKIIGAYPYAQGSVVVGKRHSFDLLVNFVGDLSQAAMQILSSSVGIVARKGVCMVGGDLIFISDTGVYRISQVIQDRLEASETPVAARRDAASGAIVDPISPLLKRINWTVASGFIAQTLGQYTYFAWAIDGSLTNNAVGIYNNVKDQWEAYDTWAGAFQIDDLYVAEYEGVRRLWAIDYASKTLYVLYEGKTDQLAAGEYNVAARFESRGYATLGWNAATQRTDKRFEIGIATWNPSITVTELTEKASDERILTPSPITKNPAKYDIFDKADFVLDNSNGDFDARGREDYSIQDGMYFDRGGGVNPDKKQRSMLRFSTQARGRWRSLRIENTQGQCDIDGILFESQGDQRTLRRAA